MVEYIFFLLIKRRPKLRLVYMVRWLHFFFCPTFRPKQRKPKTPFRKHSPFANSIRQELKAQAPIPRSTLYLAVHEIDWPLPSISFAVFVPNIYSLFCVLVCFLQEEERVRFHPFFRPLLQFFSILLYERRNTKWYTVNAVTFQSRPRATNPAGVAESVPT